MYLDIFITYSCFFKFVYEARQYYAYCEAEEPEKEKAKSIPTENVRASKQDNIMGSIVVRIWPGRRTRRGKVIFYTH